MSLLEKSVRAIANRMIKDMGHVEDLRIDTKARTGSALLLLAGEKEPVTVDVGAYELVRVGDKVMLQLRDITCSREWMEKLADRLEPQMNLELPAAAVSVLKLLKMV